VSQPAESLEPPDDEPVVAPDIDPPLDPPAESYGGDPDEARRYPSTIGGGLYIAVLITAATAIGIVVGGDWRAGVRVLAGALVAAAGFRLVLRRRDAGMLAVRHRLLDVTLFVAVAVLLWWLAGSIPEQPGP
jgi:hypothetical protein